MGGLGVGYVSYPLRAKISLMNERVGIGVSRGNILYPLETVFRVPFRKFGIDEADSVL